MPLPARPLRSRASLWAPVILAGSLGAQPVSFPAEVALITVDAIVLDADGSPVHGLSRDDFVVTEDGQPQALASFEAISIAAPPTTPEPPTAVATNTRLRAPGRSFALIVGDARLSVSDAARARLALQILLDSALGYGDEASWPHAAQGTPGRVGDSHAARQRPWISPRRQARTVDHRDAGLARPDARVRAAAGVLQVRVVARDPQTSALVSVAQRLELPGATELSLTTPIVTNRLAPQQAQGPPQPALAVHRTFAPEGAL